MQFRVKIHCRKLLLPEWPWALFFKLKTQESDHTCRSSQLQLGTNEHTNNFQAIAQNISSLNDFDRIPPSLPTKNNGTQEVYQSLSDLIPNRPSARFGLEYISSSWLDATIRTGTVVAGPSLYSSASSISERSAMQETESESREASLRHDRMFSPPDVQNNYNNY